MTEQNERPQFVRKEGTGIVFKNTKTKDSQPDWRIEFKLRGVLFKVAVWEKPDKPNMPYSFAIEAINDQQIAAPSAAPASDPANMDDLPF